MKIGLCVPTASDSMSIYTAKTICSINKIKNIEIANYIVSGSLVYDARNQMTEKALNDGCDYIFFIDSDMDFDGIQALNSMLTLKEDIVSGLYFGRRNEHNPIAYSKIVPRLFNRQSRVDAITDISKAVFPIEACGMGCCLISRNALLKIEKRYKTWFTPIRGLGEDISFCYRAKKCGIRIMCDNRFEVNHFGAVLWGKKDYGKQKED